MTSGAHLSAHAHAPPNTPCMHPAAHDMVPRTIAEQGKRGMRSVLVPTAMPLLDCPKPPPPPLSLPRMCAVVQPNPKIIMLAAIRRSRRKASGLASRCAHARARTFLAYLGWELTGSPSQPARQPQTRWSNRTLPVTARAMGGRGARALV
eukprot:364643-Chlamydomonas_euryale.AAC.1